MYRSGLRKSREALILSRREETVSIRMCALLLHGIVIGLLGTVLSVQAQIVLKPNGQNAAPLRMKAISAEAIVEGAVAATRQTLIFQNETSEQIEADFIYTLPLNTVVTYFAYWYGKEKVVARIMEKERAAAIYAHITSRMRDPALIEMVGKSTFRARIFPVMPNADLKVEMHLATAVPADSSSITYVYPFPAQSNQLTPTTAQRKATIDKPKSREKLDSMDVRVVFRQPANLLDITTNYGTLERKEANGYVRFRLHGKRYQPHKDLRVTARRTTRPLQADLTAARTAGTDGFFTLALVTEKPLTQPQVQIAGVATSEVFTQGDKANKHIFRLFGKYQGSGAATVTLRGISDGQPIIYTAPLVFEAKTVRNNAASKLWAANKIEKLTEAKGKRSAIIALSKRYNLPSKYTSWLAVPKEEMKRYEQERIEAEIEVVANNLAYLIARKQGETPTAKRFRAELNQLCRRLKYPQKPEDALSHSLQNVVDTTANALAEEIKANRGRMTKAKHLRAELKYLTQYTGENAADLVRSYLENDVSNLAEKLLRAETGLWNGKIIRSLDGDYYYHYTALNPDPAKARRLRSELQRLTRVTGISPTEYLKSFDGMKRMHRTFQLREQIIAERRSAKPNKDNIRKLETEFTRLNTANSNKKSAQIRTRRLVVKQDLFLLDQQINASGANPALTQQRAKLAKEEASLRARMGDPLISVDAPADTMQVIAILPGGEVKRLVLNTVRQKWEARFDIPTYAAEGAYAITVILVRKDGTRQNLTMNYHVDITPPQGTGKARAVTMPEPTLRLELSASPDTARVTALLPWKETVQMNPSMQKANAFFALVKLPKSYRTRPAVVTYILTDQAHNRTTITVDME